MRTVDVRPPPPPRPAIRPHARTRAERGARALAGTRDPVVVQSYMGYKSMDDPLYRAGDLMLRASGLVGSDADFERYNAALEKWNNKARQSARAASRRRAAGAGRPSRARAPPRATRWWCPTPPPPPP